MTGCWAEGAFDADFVTALAEDGGEPSAGLRMLQTHDCELDCMQSLPPSLQYLSISDANTNRIAHGTLAALLRCCGDLRELYLLNHDMGVRGVSDLMEIGAACPRLRVLVVKLQVGTLGYRSEAGSDMPHPLALFNTRL